MSRSTVQSRARSVIPASQVRHNASTAATNVASVRHEINDTIQAQQADRTVTSMGKVSTERAVVYTTSKAGTRQEETWVKDGAGWKLDSSSAMN